MSLITEHRLIWQDHVIEIVHTSNFCAQIGLDHLQIECVSPERAALPFTETGFRSHFLGEDVLIREGGAVAYVTAWLNEASQSPQWQAQVAQSRQGSLF